VVNPLRSWRIGRAESRLRKLHAEWILHISGCVRCRLASTGNRSTRRSVKGRFCAAGGLLLVRIESALAELKRLTERKVMTVAAKPGQGAG
jgi:hypothetical protein